MYLKRLSKIILAVEKDGLSKVRFAKTIYFVHKELIRRGLSEPNDISYIRMPLGPVPVGFMELADLCKDINITRLPMGLSYDMNVYTLNRLSRITVKRDVLFASVQKILERLKPFSTSKLVEVSHEEPSWKNHTNSEHFTISQKDMDKTLPRKTKTNALNNEGYEDVSLQASLVDGMIDDIVEESTALEFPENGR